MERDAFIQRQKLLNEPTLACLGCFHFQAPIILVNVTDAYNALIYRDFAALHLSYLHARKTFNIQQKSWHRYNFLSIAYRSKFEAVASKYYGDCLAMIVKVKDVSADTQRMIAEKKKKRISVLS